MTSDLSTIGPFPLGVNNRRQDHDMTQQVSGGRVDLLRSASNVDITDDGKVRRRSGYASAIVENSVCHSLWGDGSEGFYAVGTTLYRLQSNGDALEKSLIRDDLAPGAELSFCKAGGTHFYTGSGMLGMVRSGERIDFTKKPNCSPDLAAMAGSLPAGRYQFCITHMGPGGESSATIPQSVELPEGCGVRISGIQTPPTGCSVRVYMTAADGDVFGLADVQIESGVADVVAMPSLGGRCQTLLLEPMPAGSIVRHSNGRLLVAAGNVLCYSEPFANGLFRPDKNYVPFPAPITIVEPCSRGVYVVADETYWFDGDISSATMVRSLPYGAVPHSGGVVPNESNTVFWISQRGLVFGAADGTVTNIQEKQLALGGGAAGASLYREQEGVTHVLTAVRDPSQTTAAASSYFDAEIVRKATKP